MAGLSTYVASLPVRALKPGEVLITEGGETGNTLYVLESGTLIVERGGVTLASMAQPNVMVGEMSVLLGTRNSATVRAEGAATVRAIYNADRQLVQDPQLSLLLATLLAERLERTSALLVELNGQNPEKSKRSLLDRIFAAVTVPADGSKSISRRDWFDS